MISLPTLTVILVAVAVGSALQRLSGMGVGLVVSPTLSLLLGPAVGVSLTNCITVVSASMIAAALWRDVDKRRVVLIVSVVLLGAVPGALVVREVPTAWLNVVVGAVVITGLVVTMVVKRLRGLPHRDGAAQTCVTSVLGAFFNTVAGVAAPVMVVHAELARWEQRSFAATMQITFGTMGLASVLSKVAVGATPLAELPPVWVLGAAALTVLVTITLVGRVAHKVPPLAARRLAVVLATTGAMVTLGRGVLQLLA